MVAHASKVLSFGSLSQDDREFDDSLDYTVKPCLKKNKQNFTVLSEIYPKSIAGCFCVAPFKMCNEEVRR